MADKTEKFPLDVRLLEKRIGYFFNDRELLKTALCHSSYSNEKKGENMRSNERLEFLGDSVLSVIASEFLYKSFPERTEGELSTLRREIVDGKSLASFAREINLGNYMLFGKGEEKNDGRDKQSNLEDAFEAFSAAMFLDGGIEKAKAFFLPFIERAVGNIFETKRFNDPKSELQEFIQRNGENVRYEKMGESGPDHDKRFMCAAMLGSNVIGRGEGKSIKEAEMNAAKEALKLFGEEDGSK